MNQILCGTLLAIGARCSDHPAILGPGALRIDELTEATKNDVDLTQYGRARETAYRKLAQQALTLADEKGLFRQRSPESIAALMFLEGLNVTDRPVDPIFAKTCANQLRDLLISAYSQPDVLGAVQNTTLAWTAVVSEYGSCFRSPSLTRRSFPHAAARRPRLGIQWQHVLILG